MTILLLVAIITSLVDNIWWVFGLRVIMGFVRSGTVLVIYVMASELAGPKYRSISGTSVWFAFTFALCSMALQAYLVQNWRHLLLITSAPYIILLPTYL